MLPCLLCLRLLCSALLCLLCLHVCPALPALPAVLACMPWRLHLVGVLQPSRWQGVGRGWRSRELSGKDLKPALHTVLPPKELRPLASPLPPHSCLTPAPSLPHPSLLLQARASWDEATARPATWWDALLHPWATTKAGAAGAWDRMKDTVRMGGPVSWVAAQRLFSEGNSAETG